MIKILITGLTDQGGLTALVKSGIDDIDFGREYHLEDATEGSEAQRKLAHALINAYFNSGAFSDDATTAQELKKCLKMKGRMGQGFEAFVYMDPHKISEGLQDAKKYKDIPEHVRSDPDFKKIIRGRLKSWTKYTMAQQRKFIDNLKIEMDTVGVNTPDYKKILKGLEEKAEERRIQNEQKKTNS